MGLAYPFAGSLVAHNSLPVFDSYAWKYRSLVAPMNSNPPAVATEPPMLYAPVSLNPRASSDSTRPNGILQATSPVFTLIAKSSPPWGEIFAINVNTGDVDGR